ncbi:leucine-rich repeat-containing protein 18 [Engraulis encrasicolus]|uniref:leucine-rich repeat-containing protein 18 n=1 Tax=Engraulis encrasicolus TaxID=184585 RepID=UPI002FD22641
MAKGARGPKVTLKMAKGRMKVTADGRCRLDLSRMGLTAFPAVVLKLKGLNELDLSRNQIEVLPASVGQMTGLVSLDLHFNKLDALPDTLAQLTSLENLNLAQNNLEEVPPCVGQLNSLQQLNLGLNRLQTLPYCLASLPNLTHLSLFDNQFERLPECVTALTPRLQHLSLHRNPLNTHTHSNSPRPSTAPSAGQRGKQQEADMPTLVPASWLCKPCLQSAKGHKGRCQEEEEFREGRFLGMTTPNSVAIMNQHIWRNTHTHHTHTARVAWT